MKMQSVNKNSFYRIANNYLYPVIDDIFDTHMDECISTVVRENSTGGEVNITFKIPRL